MATHLLDKPQPLWGQADPRDQAGKEGRVYAIAFDMDIESLKINDGDPYNNAWLMGLNPCPAS